jgi:hypothetical protein
MFSWIAGPDEARAIPRNSCGESFCWKQAIDDVVTEPDTLEGEVHLQDYPHLWIATNIRPSHDPLLTPLFRSSPSLQISCNLSTQQRFLLSSFTHRNHVYQ